MLSENDERRLKVGAQLTAKWYATPLLIFAPVVFVVGSVVHVTLALKYAHIEGLSVQELLSLWGGKVELSREYSGTIVRARDSLSTALWEMFVGLYFLSVAHGLWSRGKFYERLRRVLSAGNA